MSARHYTVGVPLTITVHDSGAVTFEVDLSELDDAEATHGYDVTEEEQTSDDLLIASGAAARVSNHKIFTIPPTA